MTMKEPFDAAQKAQQEQRWQEAIDGFRQCLDVAPENIAARFNLSQSLLSSGAMDLAIDELKQLIAMQPEESYWVEVLAETLYKKKKITAAIECIQSSLLKVLQPGDLLSRLGTYFQSQNQLENAIAYGHWAVQSDPEKWQHRFNLANSYFISECYEAALSVIESFVLNDETDHQPPFSAHVYRLWGEVLTRLQRPIDAIDVLQKIQDWNAQPTTLNALGVAAYEAGYLKEAQECLAQATHLDPGYLLAHYHLANVWAAQRQYKKAISRYQELLTHQPKWPEAELSLAVCLLSINHWQEGFQHYSARWGVAQYQQDLLQSSVPFLSGTLNRIHPQNQVLIWAEQGIGDEILFLPFFAEFKQRHSNATLALNKRLIPLVSRAYSNWSIVERTAQLSADEEARFSSHLPLAELPKLLNAHSIQSQAAYLKVDQDQVNALKAQYAADMCIGISWRGGKGKQQTERSISIDDLAVLKAAVKTGPASGKNVKWVSLQYGITDAEKAALQAVFGESLIIDDSVNGLIDLDRFASQITAMDKVISVDNSTVHLAGALGVNTWVLLPEMPEWRWPRQESGQASSPQPSQWYDSVKVWYKEGESWVELLSQVATHLSSKK